MTERLRYFRHLAGCSYQKKKKTLKLLTKFADRFNISQKQKDFRLTEKGA